MIRTLRHATLLLAIVFVLAFLPKPAATSWKDPPCVPGACKDPLPAEGYREAGSLATELGRTALARNGVESLSTLVLEATLPFTATGVAFLPFVTKPAPPLGWVPIGPSEGDALLDIDVAPNDSNRLYASSRTGIYRSLDRGASWELAVPGFFRQLVIDPQRPNILYTGPHDDSYRYGIYKSTDGGDTWAHYDEGMTCEDLAALSIAATEPNILFTGSF